MGEAPDQWLQVADDGWGMSGEDLELGADLRDLLVTIWTESDMNDEQRSVVSAFIMNEVVPMEDLEMIEKLADKGGPAVARELRARGRAAGKKIRVTSIRNGR